jgi:poly(3-hydroxybutyrate) depolymerase
MKKPHGKHFAPSFRCIETLMLIIFLLLSAVNSATALDNTAAQLGPGKGMFPFEQAGKHVTVWYVIPSSATPSTPIVFVMHGIKRDAESYRDDWSPFAERCGFILVVPEFSEREFPKAEGYIYGNIIDRKGAPVPADAWAFNMIEPIFDVIRSRTHNTTRTYGLYGHSAGAQFVHRYLYFTPAARVSHIVIANAGWYTLPDLSTDFPYGLKGSPAGEAQLRNALSRPLIVLLGDADIDPHHPSLRHTPEAEAQGPNRFARGRFFFEQGRKQAEALNVPFGWHLDTAPGVRHSDYGMIPSALKWLLPGPEDRQ